MLPFGKFITNSIFLSIAMPMCMIAVASLTAYALTRLEFKGKDLVFTLFLSLMISWTLGMVMTLIVFRAGKWRKKMYASAAKA